MEWIEIINEDGHQLWHLIHSNVIVAKILKLKAPQGYWWSIENSLIETLDIEDPNVAMDLCQIKEANTLEEARYITQATVIGLYKIFKNEDVS